MVNWVDILHRIDDNSFQNLYIFETTNQTHCAALYQNVTLSQQLQGFQSVTIGPNESLSSFDKPLFVPDVGSDFDYF